MSSEQQTGAQQLNYDDYYKLCSLCKKYYRDSCLYAIFLFIFLMLNTIGIHLYFILMLMVFQFLFLCLFINSMSKAAKIKKALKRGIKQIYTGKLLKLETSGYRYLKYTIGHKTIKVIKPAPLQKLSSCNSIQNTRVCIEVFTITTKYIILLNVYYPDIKPIEEKYRTLAVEEKMKYYKKNIKQTDTTILYVAMAVVLLFSVIITYYRVFEALPFLFLPLILIAGITFYERKKYYNIIKLLDKKVLITGIITEIIETRIHISGRYTHFPVTLYWFRIGNKLVSDHIVNRQPDIMAGDLVNITYYINKAMKNEEVVSITKLS